MGDLPVSREHSIEKYQNRKLKRMEIFKRKVIPVLKSSSMLETPKKKFLDEHKQVVFFITLEKNTTF